ncbi:hypothetical protein BD289DRAFT_230981 [Coniella lustricola]|uniref:Uncharacterized protein n=1 Tax=Coniella lustricola TaxID=2025994 RepID=A0A2T2ZRS9_9PEZI|nr:hypothetical protein BD289DRAFT_230981 [Coniella lustricola]
MSSLWNQFHLAIRHLFSILLCHDPVCPYGLLCSYALCSYACVFAQARIRKGRIRSTSVIRYEQNKTQNKKSKKNRAKRRPKQKRRKQSSVRWERKRKKSPQHRLLFECRSFDQHVSLKKQTLFFSTTHAVSSCVSGCLCRVSAACVCIMSVYLCVCVFLCVLQNVFQKE